MQSPSGAIVATENLSRTFGTRRAVDGVTIKIAAGETLAVFGPNGAGKTTLLRMLGGLLRPTGGTAWIGDVALPGGPEVRRRIGVISHHTLLYDALTVRENVIFAARLYGCANPLADADAAIERMKISDRANTIVRSLSRGLRQRVSVARAIVHRPSVVLADEPFTGLDVAGASSLTGLLDELTSSGAALVLVTHNIDEGLSLASHAAVMTKGRIERVIARGDIDSASFAVQYQQIVAANG